MQMTPRLPLGSRAARRNHSLGFCHRRDETVTRFLACFFALLQLAIPASTA
jgi:hypothetical protein